jgi:hypothetical protein
MMGHFSFDPIIMFPQDRKPKGYMFWLHVALSYYFKLFIDKKLALQKKRYMAALLEYGRWKQSLADRRATESANGARPPFVDLAIKLNTDDLAEDFINDCRGQP